MTNIAFNDRSGLSDDRISKYALSLYKLPDYLDDPDEIVERENYAIEGTRRPNVIEFSRRKHFHDPFDPEPIAA